METEKKKSEKINSEKQAEKKNLLEKLTEASADLLYISESEGAFEAFVWKNGKKFTEVKAEDVLRHERLNENSKINELSLDEFFKTPTMHQDWHGEEEKEQVEGFIKLKKLLETELHDTRVFKIGETQVDVYIIGIDADGNLAGVKTTAVET